MKKRHIYIAVSVLLIALIAALVGWAIFVGRQQQELQRDTQDLGVFGSPTGGGGRVGGGGLFGGVFGDDKDTAADTAQSSQPTLRQLYNLPIAGYTKKRASAVRFVDRATGHVFEKELPDGSSTRINQTTVPRVQRAVFTEDGDGVVRQYIDEGGALVTVYSDVAQKRATSSAPFRFPVLDVVPSPNGDRLAVLERTAEGSSVVITEPNGVRVREVFRSALRGWTLDWRGDTILITQKASNALPGSAYLVRTTGGAPVLALQQRAGLSAKLSPDGASLLYHTVRTGERPVLFVYDIARNTSTPLNTFGFVDKCAWHPREPLVYCALPGEFPDAVYPDDWYQGGVHFSDSLWQIDTKTGQGVRLLSPTASSGVSLDMVNITTDAAGDTIFFKNKTDQTLWSITLPPRGAEEDNVPDDEAI